MSSTTSRIGELGSYTREVKQEKPWHLLAMLVLGKIQKERNARVFQNYSISSNMLVAKIKDDAVM
jgi:hypothetical protein